MGISISLVSNFEGNAPNTGDCSKILDGYCIGDGVGDKFEAVR